MADFSSVPTVELLTRAADAAGTAADLLERWAVADGIRAEHWRPELEIVLLAAMCHLTNPCGETGTKGPGAVDNCLLSVHKVSPDRLRFAHTGCAVLSSTSRYCAVLRSTGR